MNEPKKILILENIKAEQDLIKEQFLAVNPQCVFIVALDRDAFFEKIDWFSYDVVLSSSGVGNVDALEAIVFLEENLTLVPFIFMPSKSEKDSTLSKTMVSKASAIILKEDLFKLSDVLDDIAANKSEHQILYDKSIEKLNKKMVMIQKLRKMISVTPQFEGMNNNIEKMLSEMMKE